MQRLQGLGNNSRVVVDVNADKVSRLEIVMSGSGGVANLDIVCADDPSIDIRKQAEGYDVRTFAPGDTVDFEIQVTNTGAVDLGSVVVSDPQLAACDNTIGFLAAGQSVTYTCSTVLDSGSSAAKVWLDNFSPAYSYAGNDGNTNFAGNWTENDPQGGGASSGRVVVGSNEKLWMNNYGYPGGNNFKPSVQRGVDLSGMETATLSFDWSTHSGVDRSDAVALEVSTDGGSSFTEISKFWGRNTSGRHESFDVSGYISSQTVFRFRVTNYYGGGDETFKVDKFKIVATGSGTAQGFINIAEVSAQAGSVTVTDSDPSEVVVDEPLCDVCVDGQRQITLKVSDWNSGRDQGETIRVREGGLGGALLFEGRVSNGGSFTFDVPNPGVTIVVTVQGYHHPDEYVKATFVSDCDLMVNDTSGNSYITLEVTELVKDGADGNCNNLPDDIRILNLSVSQGTDDAEERSNGSMYLNSSDLELIYDGSNQRVGMRFTGVSIPQGATVSKAYIEFQTDETNSGSTSLTFRGHDTDNAATFTSASNNISSRGLTASSAAWHNVPAWNTVGDKHHSPDLSAIVQEIVDRGGWSTGNSMAFIVSGSGERTAESYEGNHAGAPRLHVEFSTK